MFHVADEETLLRRTMNLTIKSVTNAMIWHSFAFKDAICDAVLPALLFRKVLSFWK